MTRLLFLCHGNICRSPMAEFADPWNTGDFDATYADVLEGCTVLLAAIPAPSARNRSERARRVKPNVCDFIGKAIFDLDGMLVETDAAGAGR